MLQLCVIIVDHQYLCIVYYSRCLLERAQPLILHFIFSLTGLQ